MVERNDRLSAGDDPGSASDLPRRFTVAVKFVGTFG
jgi:hypothetical protein